MGHGVPESQIEMVSCVHKRRTTGPLASKKKSISISLSLSPTFHFEASSDSSCQRSLSRSRKEFAVEDSAMPLSCLVLLLRVEGL